MNDFFKEKFTPDIFLLALPCHVYVCVECYKYLLIKSYNLLLMKHFYTNQIKWTNRQLFGHQILNNELLECVFHKSFENDSLL